MQQSSFQLRPVSARAPSAGPTLRPYQEEAIAAIKERLAQGVRRLLVAHPTGCHRIGQGLLRFDGRIVKVEDIKVGDLVPMAPNGFGFPVAFVEPEETLVLYGDTRQGTGGMQLPLKPGDYMAASWGLYLFERLDGATRLVARLRAGWAPTVTNALFYRAFLEPGAFLMERKMLLGIKERAESLARAA